MKRKTWIALILATPSLALCARFTGRTPHEVARQVIENHYKKDRPGATIKINFVTESHKDGTTKNEAEKTGTHSVPALVTVEENGSVVDGGKVSALVFTSNEGGFFANPFNLELDWDAIYYKMAKEGRLQTLTGGKIKEDGSVELKLRKADEQDVLDSISRRKARQ